MIDKGEDMTNDFDLIVKNQTETVTINEVENNLNIRFKKMSRLSSTVKPDDVMVDLSYQRTISDSRVKSIIKNFNKNAIGVVTLSIRENGDLYVIDGQHRIEALKALGKGSEEINAIVFFDLSIADEAELFVIMNEGRTKPKRYDLHKASVSSGDVAANEINNILASYGLQPGDRPGFNIVRAVGTLHKVHAKVGKERLDSVIKVLLDANGSYSTSFQAEYITAVAAIFVQYNNIDKARLSNAIKTLGNPDMVVMKASNAAPNSKPFSKIISLASIMIDAYNYRLTKNRLDKVVILSCDARSYLGGN